MTTEWMPVDLIWKRCLAAEMPATYAASIHHRDPVRQARLYAPDGILEQIWGVSTGRDEIAAAYGTRFAEWTDATHWTTNVRVTACAEENATVQSFILGLFFFKPEHNRDQLLYRGEYKFELTWNQDRWEIARLTITRHGVSDMKLGATSFQP